MPRVLISNFHFEDELAAGATVTVPQHLLCDTVQRECGWLAVANSDDVLPLSLPADLSFLTALKRRGLTPPTIVTAEQGVKSVVRKDDRSSWMPSPWGWSPSVVAHWQRDMGAQRPLHEFVPCPLEIVAAANDRLTSLRFEQSEGIAPVGVTAISSIAGFLACLRSLQRRLAANGSRISQVDGGWVLKSRWGAAGRDKLHGSVSESAANTAANTAGQLLNDRMVAWLQRRLDRDGSVIFEPWLDSVAEAGLQFEVTPAGDVVDLGIVPLISDARGGYLGSVVPTSRNTDASRSTTNATSATAVAASNTTDTASNTADCASVNGDPYADYWQSAATVARRLVAQLAAGGYRGPVGVDAMLYRRSDGSICVRPVQEVNARWTFGRLAIGWSKLLRIGETATWLHGSTAAVERWQTALQRHGHVAEWLSTSPCEIAGSPARRISVLVISADETARALRRVLLTPEDPE